MGGACGTPSDAYGLQGRSGAPPVRGDDSDAGSVGPPEKRGSVKVQRRMSSLAFLQARRGSLTTLQSEVKHNLDAINRDRTGGVARGLLRDGVLDYIAGGIVDIRSRMDEKSIAEGLALLQAACRTLGEEGPALFERHRQLVDVAGEHVESAHAAPHAVAALAAAAAASPAAAERVFRALEAAPAPGRLHALWERARGKGRGRSANVEDEETAYDLLATLAACTAVKEAFVQQGRHKHVLEDLGNPMRQNRYRLAPARLLLHLALHQPLHEELERAGALRAAVLLSRHPEGELAGTGLRALVGLMQTERTRQRLAREMVNVARHACAGGDLAAPALRCVRLVAEDTGPWEKADWVEEAKEQELEAELALLGMLEAGSLRRGVGRVNGESAVARLFASEARLGALAAQMAAGPVGMASPAACRRDPALALSPWTLAADAVYVLATLTACGAGVALLAHEPVAAGLLKARPAPPRPELALIC
eukprot:tig00020538_g10355.t1